MNSRPRKLLVTLLLATAGSGFLPGCGTLSERNTPRVVGREGGSVGTARQEAADRAIAQRKLDQEQAKTDQQEAIRQAVLADRAERAQAGATRAQDQDGGPPPPTQVGRDSESFTATPQTAPVESGPVMHVVVMWLKQPGDAAIRQKLIDACATLKGIPGVVDAVAGSPLPGADRPVIDASYDVAFTITFTGVEALKNYGGHPTHVKLVEELVKPNVERFVVYDFAAR